MTIFKIERTEATKNFTESIFLATIDGIYVESPELGFFEHPRIKTMKDLRAHLSRMTAEGFNVVVTEITAKA